MAKPGFYNDNSGRRFPFVTNAETEAADGVNIPNDLILDCGFTFGIYSGCTKDTKVWLSAISISTTLGVQYVTLTFETDATFAAEIPLEFTVPITKDYNLVFEDATGMSSAPTSALDNGLLWYGYVVVSAQLTATQEFLAGDNELTAERHTVEPALIHNLDKTYVRSVNLANLDRVRTDAISINNRQTHVVRKDIAGQVRFIEGYNTKIAYNAQKNALVFSAVEGAGAGYPCGEVKRYSTEVPPTGSQLLSGGPKCNEVVKTINGVSGPHITLLAGPGTIIEKNPTVANQLDITIDSKLLSNCEITGS